MIQALFSRVTFLRQRARALLHRSRPLEPQSAERRERWNQVMAGHRQAPKPVGQEDAATKQ